MFFSWQQPWIDAIKLVPLDKIHIKTLQVFGVHRTLTAKPQKENWPVEEE